MHYMHMSPYNIYYILFTIMVTVTALIEKIKTNNIEYWMSGFGQVCRIQEMKKRPQALLCCCHENSLYILYN